VADPSDGPGDRDPSAAPGGWGADASGAPAPITTRADPSTRTFPCRQCGARLEYAPGTTVLRCPYCGFEQQVAGGDTAIEEHDYVAWQTSPIKPTGRVGAHALKCPKCGAQTESDDLSTLCPFCGAPIIADVDPTEQISPEGVVPFHVDRAGAQNAIRQWVGSRWFAPNRLKKAGTAETLKGTYLPHWTFDASTQTHYSGMRGQHYWETETYTEMVDGQPQTRTREVMRTQWWPASGEVARAFDDVLVLGSTRLSPDRVAALSPWSLDGAKTYQPDYLSGYQTLRYDVQPDQGLELAKQQMRSVIQDDCRADIGGDEQQVHSMDTSYTDLMFKLMLLPVWVAAYLYGGKTYQVFVNAHTGQVVGERPYSIPKIVAAVVAGLILLVVAFLVWQSTQTPSAVPSGP
jgi:DNA-directed RNA polymerase subunit RPC12/RpoP